MNAGTHRHTHACTNANTSDHGGLRSVRSVARSLDRVDRFGRFGTRIAAKLRGNAFRTICNFRFFDAGKFFSEILSLFKNFFLQFLVIFGRFWADF